MTMKQTKRFIIPVILLLFVLLDSCEKAYLAPKLVEITDSVSFSLNVQPILTAKCANGSTCHVPGGHPLNLTEGIAYDELINGGYADPADPDGCILNTLITTSDDGSRMPPPPDLPLTGQEIGYIQAWLRQGCLNN